MLNEELIKHFYTSFKNGDAEGMVLCYDSNIVFSDPVFGEVQGTDAMNMWRMLLENSKGQLKINFENILANNKSGSANWVAEYQFSKTGRKVINHIQAQFEFQNGKIIRHTDKFDLWLWSQQALGWKGYVFGWTPFMKMGIRKMAIKSLSKYQANLHEKT